MTSTEAPVLAGVQAGTTDGGEGGHEAPSARNTKGTASPALSGRMAHETDRDDVPRSFDETANDGSISLHTLPGIRRIESQQVRTASPAEEGVPTPLSVAGPACAVDATQGAEAATGGAREAAASAARAPAAAEPAVLDLDGSTPAERLAFSLAHLKRKQEELGDFDPMQEGSLEVITKHTRVKPPLQQREAERGVEAEMEAFRGRPSADFTVSAGDSSSVVSGLNAGKSSERLGSQHGSDVAGPAALGPSGSFPAADSLRSTDANSTGHAAAPHPRRSILSVDEDLPLSFTSEAAASLGPAAGGAGGAGAGSAGGAAEKSHESFFDNVEGRTAFELEEAKMRSQKGIQEVGLGKRIGFYQIRQELGVGNFGTVKMGLHVLSKEKVAIKILGKL